MSPAVNSVLSEIVPLAEGQPAKAAELFNATGRKRYLRVGSLIVSCDATLATANTHAFEAFREFGLQLTK